MKIWLSKNSEIPVREQLLTQIALGIVSGDLPIGEKLPSTREIARRFTIHSNTVSAVYRKLSADGWLEFKKGSGFYVCKNRTDGFQDKLHLDKLIADFIGNLYDLGFTAQEIKKSIRHNFTNQTPEKIILVESDADLREIVAEEIRAKLNIKVTGINFEEFKNKYHRSKAIFVGMYGEKTKIEQFLRNGQTSVFLKAHSVPSAMSGEQRPSENELIAVVSGWKKFLVWSKTFLIAARIEAECLILKDAKLKNWQKGLENASIIICDSLTAAKLRLKDNVRVFPIVSEQSLAELQGKCLRKSA
ncbi:MAG: GntR family transcriptional regulator [Pyrinomonadaceae bacterium]|nr:GntR family transcriptional regulator [Pyrinomonadaceae bacterium]